MIPMGNATPKPMKGEHWLERKARSLKADAHEAREMRAAKQRDGRRCRRPRCPYAPRKPRVEACHLKELHRGIGGNPKGDRTTQKDLITLCFIEHKAYDRGDLVIERLTPEGFNGPCDFYERNKETGSLDHIGTETRIGVSVTREAK